MMTLPGHGVARRFDAGAATVGRCLYFNALKTQYAQAGNVLGFERSETRTGVLWFCATKSGVVVSKETTAGVGWAVAIENTGALTWRLRGATGGHECSIRTTATSWIDGRWHCLVFWTDGTSTPGGMGIEIDGVAQTTTTVSNTLASSILTTAYLMLGGRGSSSGNAGDSHFTGALRGFGLYSKVCDSTERARIYGGRSFVDLTIAGVSGLLGYWPIEADDSVSGSAVTDASGNGNHFTAIVPANTSFRAVTRRDVVDSPVAGWGSRYDGTDNTISFGDNVRRDATDSYTLVTWERNLAGGYYFSKYNGTSFRGYAFLGTLAGGAEIRIQSGNGTDAIWAQSTTGGGAPSTVTGDWTMVVWTYNGSKASSGLVCYINGASVAHTASVDNLVNTTISDGNLRTGARDFSGGGATAFGLMDLANCAQFPTVLNSTQVAQLYALGPCGDVRTIATPDWYVRGMATDNASSVDDVSTGNHDGTPSGMQAWEARMPILRYELAA
jgi:hypothetical protein